MKVFACGKVNGYSTYLNNSEIKEKSIKISSDELFNSLKLINPENGNLIYIIEKLEIVPYDSDNKLEVLIGEENCKAQNDDLNINCNFTKNFDNCIEIKNFCVVKSKGKEIFKEQRIFVLPGGCIVLNFDRKVKSLGVNMMWNEETIY
ncbi:hypothetical protein ACJDT4_17365 [Clostridium neuense]|uniref:Uncharacterized protein n=1 Tax=Clostridium neuense TaxID=1728934 RepID=A0ABW8TKZ9_9CLOT